MTKTEFAENLESFRSNGQLFWFSRFIAVTQPIKYAKHKSNTRVWLTIVFVWAFSGLVGSPIVLGLNAPPSDEPLDGTVCSFHNKYFVLFSSLCSFYIPCAILVFLYWRIFKVSQGNLIHLFFLSSWESGLKVWAIRWPFLLHPRD